MSALPPIAEAVTALHNSWVGRVERWQRLAWQLPKLPPAEGRRALTAVVAELEKGLLPYMEIEEGMLASSTDLPMLSLEHATIRRSSARVRDVTMREPFDPHAAQARLARLCVALLDHLRHEQTTYLPRVVSRARGEGLTTRGAPVPLAAPPSEAS